MDTHLAPTAALLVPVGSVRALCGVYVWPVTDDAVTDILPDASCSTCLAVAY